MGGELPAKPRLIRALAVRHPGSMATKFPGDGRLRTVIENVYPEIDGGRFPVKRIVGETVDVEADIFVDGHEALSAVLEYRAAHAKKWLQTPMEFPDNDRYRASFAVESIGFWEFRIAAWLDPFRAWARDLLKREAAGEVTAVELEIGAQLIEEAAKRAKSAARRMLSGWAGEIRARSNELPAATALAMDAAMNALALAHADREHETVSPILRVRAERQRAQFSSWYEVFPRSTAPVPGRHGTLRTLCDRLESIAAMGFDVVYLPPVHPIGSTFRKGKNGSARCEPGDVGSPWAIGSSEGGHAAIHPDLGDFDDFAALARRAECLGMEIALDIAFQCSPDHPWVSTYPSFFKSRPDGSIQYAENPPKKYQDIYPLDFDTPDWKSLWRELLKVFLFWCERGVRIFRVDNPHTKPFPFWEWTIAAVQEKHPGVIFLAEAFTRPKVMHRLAKLGFTQSYTYFTWRNGKDELTEYLKELTQTDAVEYFRPNFWPNTPDILHETLQRGGRAAFMGRAVMAATMASNWGVYGPAFELCENVPREPGSEEYLNSEKYEIRWRDLDAPWSLSPLLARLNAIRKENAALQRTRGCEIHAIDNPALLCYSRGLPSRESVVLVVVNLDWNTPQSGFTNLNMAALGLDADARFRVTDLLADASYSWQGPRNYVLLDPHVMPAHVFRIQRI